MEESKRMMKRPLEQVYGSDASESFNKGKEETTKRYRLILDLVKKHRKTEAEWYGASSKVQSISARIDLLEAIMEDENFDFAAELKKLEAKYLKAEGILLDVKVEAPNWEKLGEPWMLDD